MNGPETINLILLLAVLFGPPICFWLGVKIGQANTTFLIAQAIQATGKLQVAKARTKLDEVVEAETGPYGGRQYLDDELEAELLEEEAAQKSIMAREWRTPEEIARQEGRAR